MSIKTYGHKVGNEWKDKMAALGIWNYFSL